MPRRMSYCEGGGLIDPDGLTNTDWVATGRREGTHEGVRFWTNDSEHVELAVGVGNAREEV